MSPRPSTSCEFYAREALRLDAATTPIQLPGEHDHLRYIPLGVGAVIPPWNFPLAIMAGMTAAAIVCGNTVVLKPSGDAPTIAAMFFEPPGRGRPARWRGQLLPRRGAKFGDAMVAHPQTRFIAFTGSKAVGLDIHERAAEAAARPALDQAHHPRDGRQGLHHRRADADLDSAVEGVAASAFGFSGQKCSACSRAIVDERIYDTLLRAAARARRAIKQGDPAENLQTARRQPEAARSAILDYIENGKAEGRLLITGGTRVEAPGDGYYIAPTVIADVAPTARIAQEEIFGPVLAVIRSANFDDALAIANNTEYGLTGAIYTASRDKIERRQARVPRRQPLLQSQMHRRHGRRTSLRRIQHERHRLQGRRPRLPAALHPGQVDWREDRKVTCKLRGRRDNLRSSLHLLLHRNSNLINALACGLPPLGGL